MKRDSRKIVLAGLAGDDFKKAAGAVKKTGADAVAADSARELVERAVEGADAVVMGDELGCKGRVMGRLRRADSGVFSVACLDSSRKDASLKALSLGHDDYLFMPFAESDLLFVLKRLESFRELGLCGEKVRGTPPHLAPFKDVVRNRVRVWMEGLPDKAFNSPDNTGWRAYFMETMERELLSVTLETLSGNHTKAARFLGMHRNTLNRRIKDLGLDKSSKK